MKEELGSSRAKANILYFWTTGQLDDKAFTSPDFRWFLDLCVNCKACSLECPSGVDVSKMMVAARAEYVKRKGLRLAEFVLSHNRYLSLLGSIFRPVSNPAVRFPPVKWFLEKAAGLDRRRQIPRFAAGSFIKAGRKFLKSCQPIATPLDRAVYFVDTYANYNDHELGFAVLEVLMHNDIEVILPEQRPAPLPAVCYGDVKTARKDLAYNAEHLAAAVRKGYKIVCSEPSAALCLQQEVRHFIAGQDAELVSKNTVELMSYLLELYRKDKLKPIGERQKQQLLSRYASAKDSEPNFAYHRPCHLSAIEAGDSSIELLSCLCGLSVVDLNGGCCGLAGTFGMQKKNYQLSEQISEPLRAALKSSQAKYVLTECSACKMQIEHISNLKVLHPIKLIAQIYSL